MDSLYSESIEDILYAFDRSGDQPAPNPHASDADTQKFEDAERAAEQLRDCSPVPDMQVVCDVAREYIAHENRNYWQDGLAPANGPPADGWVDPETGLTWHNGLADHVVGHLQGYHSGDDCARATGPVVDAYRGELPYQEWLQDLQATAAHPVGPYGTEPGVQVCYDQQTHELTASGTFDAQTPGSTASVAGDIATNFISRDEPYWTHHALDMAPHDAFGGDAAYVTYNTPEARTHEFGSIDPHAEFGDAAHATYDLPESGTHVSSATDFSSGLSGDGSDHDSGSTIDEGHDGSN